MTSDTADPTLAPGKILRVVAGTAGHIDHGKSTLVRCLTGIDPDRLPEEKARGLTIDLGFANLQLSDGSRLGLIDVPGHERFVHNMVARATGIDFVIFVVAADDGVMPQTLEHLEILELLGISRGVIALTKIDAVAPALRELVEEDVRQTVAGTFLQNAPLFPVSSLTGEGVGALRDALERLARETPPRRTDGLFRVPVQRVFAAKGFGCVLTGVPVSGSLTIGDRVEVLPGGLQGTVRGLEAYHCTVERVAAGHSSAMNISGIEASSCERGMAVATPGCFTATQYVTLRIKHLARRKKPLRDRESLRFHIATKETGATLCLLDRASLAPGDSAIVQLKLDEPVVAAPGDRFLVRAPSPAATVGGGVVIDIRNIRLRRNRPEVLADLGAAEKSVGDARARVLLELGRAAFDAAKAESIAKLAILPISQTIQILDDLAREGACTRLRTGAFLLNTQFQSARKLVDDAVNLYFKENPQRLVMERLELRERTQLDSGVLDDVLADLAKCGRIELEAGGGARTLQKQAAALPPDLAKLRDEILLILQKSRFQPPSADELAAAARVARPKLEIVLKRLVEEKLAARVSPEFYFSMSAVDEAKAAVTANCALHTTAGGDGELDLPSLRDALGTTRRYLIPLVEWFDTIQFTTRLGARRILKKKNR